MTRSGKLLLLTILTLFASPAAHASVVIHLMESGADVLMTLSGSLNLSGLTLSGSSPSGYFSQSLVRPNGPRLVLGSPAPYSIYTGVTPSGPFGAGSGTFTSLLSGDILALSTSSLYLAQSYSSGDPLSSSATFQNTTLAAMGANPGTYTWTLPADTITLVIAPEPGTWGLFAGGTVLIALLRRRRR